ncbi:MAG TPA: DUF3037 domain-containing protein [Candidatus Saccharimonadales bacterium]|nr:DUF3037 domain-containing protein [Candidatus Saccharimonadales bacterium]
MKTTYSTITFRYVHDVVTGEFANIGVVLYSPEQRFLEARFATSYERLNAIFLKIDHLHYRALMRYLANRFEEIAAEIRDGLHIPPLTALNEIVRQVLPSDDSSLQWSQQGGGFTEEPEKTLDELYKRFVERYIAGAEQVSRSDEEIARPFKAKLGRMAEKLAEKKIETKDYQYDFRFAWKNEIWHLYEPVSFDLVDPGSIREKANKWLGRGVALHDAKEKFKIHFLLGEPRQDETKKAFENAIHLLGKIPGEKELVRENAMEQFAEHVAEEIGSHEASEMALREQPKNP